MTTARQKSLSARTPKLCALYFPGEETTGIAPVSNVTDGQLIEGESVRCEWDGETVTATIVKLSDYRSVLDDALEDYKPETTEPTAQPQDTATESTTTESDPTEDNTPTPTASRPSKPAQKKTKKGAQDLGSGSAQRQATIPDNIPDYQIDPELEAILQEASENKRSSTTQVELETVENSTQTPDSCHDVLLRKILDKVTELETKMTEMQAQLSSQARPTTTTATPGPTPTTDTPTPTATTSDLVSAALSTLHDPFDFEASETSVLQPLTPRTPSRFFSSTPRRQQRVTVSELGFWKLLPCEILANDQNSVLEAARTRLPTDEIPLELSTMKTEELKATCLNQRTQFAKNLVHNLITVGELYNRNVNGRNSTGISKQKINPVKMSYVKDLTYKVFPCLPTEMKTSWSECVKVIDKSNVYLFNVIDKKFNISEIMDYL